eukprot:TRINITY_DN7472_c0_g1_i1.p2 TRINITY_DN7472_c0_g1~~TRINITY_DN7472_c0_g1_i1.p2  ORF type:complete len:139 (-),score=39.02 TRINITY_DN7472_c0_g1_i1:125-541(-)
MGNFYLKEDGEIGVIDFQCVAHEHPMRDVTYFLASSYPQHNIEQDEPELLQYYHQQLTHNLKLRDPALRAPSMEECRAQQKLQAFYAMFAWVFSGGVPDAASLMDLDMMGRVSIGRVAATLDRLGCEDALHELLKARA